MTKGKVVGKGMYSRQREKGRDNYRVKVEEVAKAFFVALFLLTWTSGTSMHVKSLQSSLILCDPMSLWFSRQEYWSRLPCSSPRDLPNPGIKPVSLMSLALAIRFFTTSTWEALWDIYGEQQKCFLQPQLVRPGVGQRRMGKRWGRENCKWITAFSCFTVCGS